MMASGMTGPFLILEWYALPLALRQRWWAETDFGKREPSQELWGEVLACL